jgi:Cu-processing system ATP-binding protein
MIAFRDFTKRYGSRAAVSSLTLTIAPGEVVALLGPNGSGKTTTIKAAAGLVRPTSGVVTIGPKGESATSPAARNSCAFLPQKVVFPDLLTGREVVSFFGALRARPGTAVDDALKLASLNGASSRLASTYSGGMTQRLGLAVAVASGAAVLLLDEPTAALDPDGLSTFYSVIERHRRQGRTVLFSSHQMGDVERLADRFAILVDGWLVATMTAQQLSDRLADRGVLTLRVEGDAADLVALVRDLAPEAHASASSLIVPGRASVRPAVIERMRAAGAIITAITTEEGRLDTLYRELVEVAR